ncbi:MAG: hypothetical protein WB443_01120 [Nitrososphaeraceae archaeon]
MTYKLGIITMEDPRADQKNVSGLMILSTIHTFLVLTYISFYNRRIRAQIRERSSSNTKPKTRETKYFPVPGL